MSQFRTNLPKAAWTAACGVLIGGLLGSSPPVSPGPPGAEDGVRGSAPTPPEIQEKLEGLKHGGSRVEIFRFGDGVAAVAAADGAWRPEAGASPPPDAIARDRAIRAAALRAKGEIAGQIRSSVSVESWLRETPERIESGTIAVRVIGRQLLADCRRWKVEATPQDGGWRARVWIWSTAARFDLSATAAGCPRFATGEEAADHLLHMATEGLVDLGTVVALVGPPDRERPMILGIAIGAGKDAERIAIVKAEAECTRASLSTVEGRDGLVRSETIEDPLSPSGSRSILHESRESSRTERASGVFRRGGHAVRTADDVTYVVVWPAD